MKFSLNFLKKIIDIKLPAKELASKLTSVGLEVEEVKKVGNDWVFDVEVTTNRFDWLSVLGIAQEVAAVSGQKIKIDYPCLKTLPKLKGVKVIIDDQQDCSYYLAKKITNVTIKDSPGWLQKIILNSGLTAVNNIVDITNYVMLKWGNPLHAFDLDKIEGDIYVRRAREGEPFIGIDQKSRILGKDNLVIADSKKIIALAGVMGAKNTEVTTQTKNILLEAAIFSPITTRRSRRQAGLNTESSYRFERKVFASFLEYAHQDASDFISELSGGLVSGYVGAGQKKEMRPKQISLDIGKLKSYLGISVKWPEVKRALELLNLEVKKISDKKLKVKPGFSRFDVSEPVDVYEEFARIYGYNKIEPTMPFLKKKEKREAVLSKKEEFWKFKDRVRNFISLFGFSEIITYSLESKKEVSLFSEEDFLSLENPLRGQEDTLRPDLFLGMIKTLKHNLNREKQNLRFFEIADIYRKDKRDITEKPFLSLGLSGNWQQPFLLKGLIFDLIDYLAIGSVKFQTIQKRGFYNSLDIIAQNKTVGFLAKLNKKIQEEFSLKQDVYLGCLDLSLLAKQSGQKVFQPFSRFPAVWRDISLAIQAQIKFADIEEIIKKESQNLAGLKIVDTYQGKDLPKDHRGFTLRIFYQSKRRTLSSEEVDAYQSNIRKRLESKDGAVLR